MKKLIFILVICVALVSCDSGPFISNYARVRQLYPNAKIYHEGDQSQANQAYWTVIDSTGIIDGDGSYYLNEKYGLRHFEISSTYEQDWKYLKDVCENLNIKYKISLISKINKKSNKLNKSSSFRIIGKEILKLGVYLYDEEIIGLVRKYNKFNQIKNSYK